MGMEFSYDIIRSSIREHKREPYLFASVIATLVRSYLNMPDTCSVKGNDDTIEFVAADGAAVDGLDAATQAQYERLQAILRDMGSVLVAYSGGVDSALLLKVADRKST